MPTAAIEHIKQQIRGHLDFFFRQQCMTVDLFGDFEALLAQIQLPQTVNGVAVVRPEPQEELGKYNALLRDKLLEADLLNKITERIPFFPAALGDILGEGSKDLASALTVSCLYFQ